MKKKLIVLLMFVVLLIPTFVNAVPSSNEIGNMLTLRFSTAFPDNIVTYKVADGFGEELYETIFASSGIYTYDEWVELTMFEYSDILAPYLFGDYYQIDTGLVDYNSDPVYAYGYIDYDFANDIFSTGYVYNVESEPGLGEEIKVTFNEFPYEIEYVDADANIINLISGYKTKMAEAKKVEYDDLYWINMLLATDLKGIGRTPSIKDAQYMTNYFTNSEENFEIAISNRLGDITPIETVFSGILPVFYDGVFYDTIDCNLGEDGQFMFYFASSIDIPDDTEYANYITVATKRITDYINNDDYEIEITKTDTMISDMEYYLNDDIAVGAVADIYNLKISYKNGEEYNYKFVIKLVDEDSITTPMVQYLEKTSNIIFETTSSDIPLYTKIVVEQINDEGEKEKISLILKTDNYVAYDMELLSSIGLIKEINNGVVTVKIPLPNGFDESATKIVYVNETENAGDEFDVRYETINDIRYAVFDTTHFSTYALINTGEVPDTYDGILIYFIILIVGITTIVILMKKNKKNIRNI